MRLYQQYVTPEGIESLKNYKYCPGEYSHLDHILNPYWVQATEYLPRWLAPNLITLTGTLLVLSSTILFTYYDRKMSADQPWYTYVWAAVCIFLYCQLDAMDGKQARRLGKGSPLGQLFDHGCDCICIALFTYNVIVILKLGNDLPSCFVLCFSTIFMFYSANWAEYHTHVLVTSNGVTGVTELELILALLNIATAILGTGFWQYRIFFGLLTRPQALPPAFVVLHRPRRLLHPNYPPWRLPRLQVPVALLDYADANFPRLRQHLSDFFDRGGRPLLPLRVLEH
jgi:phosphatidylglycerophosphate synthase